MSHKVRTHHYKHGHLTWEDREFLDFVSALDFAKKAICDNFKIFNDAGVCVYSVQNSVTNDESYA
jgi:hypothetical protein